MALPRENTRFDAIDELLFIERQRTEVALNAIADAVVITDAAGEVTFLNVAAERITGWSRPEAIGRPLSEVMPLIDGVTREPIGDLVEAPPRLGPAVKRLVVRR